MALLGLCQYFAAENFAPKLLRERSYSSVHDFQVFTISKILFQIHTNHQHYRRTCRTGTRAILRPISLDEAKQ